jgi:hypothetical protein
VSASDNGWSAVLWDDKAGRFVQSQRYDVRVVDRVGGGDSFAAGLLYGLLTGRDPEASLRFAVASSALKQTIPGDFNRLSVAEVDRLVKGDASHPSNYHRELHRPQHGVRKRAHDGRRTWTNGRATSPLRAHHSE